MLRLSACALVFAAFSAVAQTNFPGGSIGTGTTTWSNTVTVAGDVIIPMGGTLVIQPGTQITVATSDSIANSDAARVEFLVAGTLNAVGSVGSLITISSTGSASNSWGGVRVAPGGSATLGHVTMNEAAYGLEATNSGTAGVTTTLTVSNSTISNSSRGLVANGASSGTLTVTATDVIFETLGYGVDMNRGSVSVTGSAFTAAPITLNGGSLSLTSSTVTNVSAGFSGAINYGSGTLLIDRSTVSYNATAGLYSCTGSSGTGSISSSIFSHNTGLGINRCTGQPTLSVTASNLWGNTNTFGPPPTAGANLVANNYNSVSSITGSISANPLFVDGSLRNFRLTSNSPSRRAGTAAVDQGALFFTSDATVGLQGTLFTNTTLTGVNTVIGDLTVAPTVTLTLAAGATLNFAATDSMGNSDGARGELLVAGTLSAISVAGTPITLTSPAGTGPSAWGGVRVLPGGTATLSNAIVEKAAFGLEATNSGSSGVTTSLTVSNSTVRNSTRGLVANGASSGTLTVTATNVIFETLGYGVDMNRGSVSVTGSAFTAAPITLNGGSLSLTSSTVTNVSAGFSGAINYGSGTLLIDRSTVSYNATAGLYSCTGSSGTGSISSSIFSHNTGLGINRCTGQPSLSVTASNLWGNTNTFGPPPTAGANVVANNYNSVSSITGSISANPLFVDGSLRNFRLTSNSPSRRAGTAAVDQGALPFTSDATVGLQGTLFTNTTLTGVNTVIGDLTVAPTVTLTLEPGTTLNFATTDSMGNSDAARGELLVAGTLNAIGVNGTPITLTSPAGTGTSAWGGVRVLPGGASSIAHAIIDKAAFGLEATNSGSSGVTTSLTVSNSTVRNSTRGLVANGSASGTLTVTATNVIFETLGYGVDMSRGSVSVTGSAFTAAPITLNGGSLSLTSSTVTNVSAGFSGAINYGSGTLLIDRSTVSYNATAGLYSCTGSSGTGSISSSIFSHNTGLGINRCTGQPSLSVTASNLWGNTNTFGPPPTAGANLVANNYNSVSSITGSISANPSFVDGPGRDFRLTSTSLSRGAGVGGVDQGAFPFVTGPITTVSVSPASFSVAAGATTGFSATARDSMNNPVGTTFTWSVAPAAGNITQTGLFTAGCTPGTYTAAVTATAPNGSFGTATVTVTLGAAATVTLSPSNGPTVKSQGTQQFTATVRDACNNPLPAATVTWAANSMAGTVNSTGLFTAGCTRGTYPNAVTATSGSLNAVGAVTVGPGDIAAIAITPMTATVQGGATQQFAAAAADGCGNTVPPPTFTWSTNVPNGSITSTGLFTAGQTNGTFNNGITVAASGTSVTANANVIVQGGTGTQVSTVTLTPVSASLAPNGTQQFTAEARNAGGQVITGLPVTWSVTAGGGIISSTGLFTAGTATGTFTNTVSAVVGGVTGLATVTVTPGPVATITVAPTSATVAPSGTATFSATPRDGFGNVASAAITWSATPAAGTINSSGVFTASSAVGTYANAVTATSGSASGSASVTIQAGALSQLTVAPLVATVQAGSQVAFTATGRDATGNAVSITPMWSVVSSGGMVSSTGVFTAGTTAGTFANTVRVEAQGLTAFATVIVTPGAAISVAVTPMSVSLMANEQRQFSAVATDAFNNTVPAAVSWAATPAAGTITPGGLFTASANAGSYSNGVTATVSGIDGFANVTVVGGAGGGMAGGTAGGMAGGSAGGMAGGSAGGMAGGSAGGMAGGSAGGMAGGSAGGMAGGDAGGMAGGVAGGATAGGAAAGGSAGGLGFGGGTAGGTAGGGVVGPPASGCGCGAVDGAFPLLGVLLMALRRRR